MKANGKRIPSILHILSAVAKNRNSSNRGLAETPVADARKYPNHIFLFGDNDRGTGKPGQAVIRGEPNAFGIRTKHKPATSPSSYFSDERYEKNIKMMKDDFVKALEAVQWNGTLVLPRDGRNWPCRPSQQSTADFRMATTVERNAQHIRHQPRCRGGGGRMSWKDYIRNPTQPLRSRAIPQQNFAQRPAPKVLGWRIENKGNVVAAFTYGTRKAAQSEKKAIQNMQNKNWFPDLVHSRLRFGLKPLSYFQLM